MRRIERYVSKTYYQQAIAERFADRLDEHVRERVLFRYEEPNDLWFSMLEQIAGYAESIWMNRLTNRTSSALQKMDVKGRRIRETKFHCSHHGPNSTHDSQDCLMLHGQPRKGFKERDEARRGALVSAGALKAAERWEERKG